MKKIYYILLLATFTTLSSCQSDWLKQEPTTGGATDEVLSNTANAKLAINGIARLMNMQHSVGTGYNGEGTIMSYMGECMGQDYIYTRYEAAFKDGENGLFNTNNTRVWDYFPWTYYYEMVMNSNTLLGAIDAADGSEAERKFIKAQALTFRAYAYSRLVELYCTSWNNSNNGVADGVVLRLTTSNGEMPLSTLGECYTQIYKDLDEAIGLYKESGQNKADMYSTADNTCQLPDEAVAHAVYARAALNKSDYNTALAQAQAARVDHPLMSVDEYNSGFNKPNKEWIWGAYSDENYYTAYFSFTSWMAYNGTDGMSRQRTPVANRQLIESFPDTDIRKALFLHKGIYLDQEVDTTYQTTDASLGCFKCTVVSSTKVDEKDSSYVAYNKAKIYARNHAAATGYSAPSNIIFPYTALKFSTPSNGTAYNIGCIPFIRASEMVLIEAEANYFLGNTQEAQANLIELNKTTGRDASYTCTKSGDDLWNEITLYRRLELWGEGHSWFDCKRWNQPVVRKSLTQGGNFVSTISGTFGASADDTFWKWVIPARETDYNSAIK